MTVCSAPGRPVAVRGRCYCCRVFRRLLVIVSVVVLAVACGPDEPGDDLSRFAAPAAAR